MTRENVIHDLSAHVLELRREYGVASLAIFGSLARDEAGAASDLDLLVEFDRPTGYFGLFRLRRRLEELLGCTVDLGTWSGLSPRVRDDVLRDAILDPGQIEFEISSR